MIPLKEKLQKNIIPEMMKEFHYKNIFEAPRLEKVVVNVGLNAGNKDPKFLETVEKSLVRITGQKPVRTLSRMSISNFKIRKGQVVGLKVTLRGRRMYDFVDKLIHVSLARVRDFRGISPKAVDRNGNVNIGIREHIVFPEIKSDEVEKIHGLEITVVSTAKTRDEGLKLFALLGFPFHK